MKNIIALMAQMLVVFILASCSVKTGTFNEVVTASSQDSVVYIYRPHSMSNVLVSPKMLIDGQQKFKIDNNSYRYVVLTDEEHLKDHPVKHVFEIEVAERYSGIHRLRLNIEQGEKVFLRVSTLLKFEEKQPYSRSFTLEQIDRAIALNEIRETHYAGEHNTKKSNNPMNENSKTVETGINNSVPEDQFSISRTRNPFDK